MDHLQSGPSRPDVIILLPPSYSLPPSPMSIDRRGPNAFFSGLGIYYIKLHGHTQGDRGRNPENMLSREQAV